MKKSHRFKTYESPGGLNLDKAYRLLQDMKHRDLQKACILRGIPSNDLVNLSHPALVNWFTQNLENTEDPNLLLQHDLWVEEQLRARGYKEGDTLLSPWLRFSYNGDIEKMDKPKQLKPQQATQVKAPTKERAKVDESTGLRTGTKKSLTYQLTMEGLEMDEIIVGVKKQFPEADEKSIKIWAKRCKKAMNDNSDK